MSAAVDGDLRVMLHVTNGDIALALLGEAGLPGTAIAWRDVLHEGPVPARVTREELRRMRATFIADRGWVPYETALHQFTERDAALADAHRGVTLWFEADLDDQLQLLQVLADLQAFHVPAHSISVVCVDAFPEIERFVGLGQLAPRDFADLYEERWPMTDDGLAFASSAWKAFTANEPTGLAAIAMAKRADLSFVPAAFDRLMHEYPALSNGLTLTEARILRAIDRGLDRAGAVFARISDQEGRPFLGDTTCWSRMSELAGAREPLLAFVDEDDDDDPSGRRLRLTPLGREVLAWEADRVTRSGIDRWIGGVHLEAGNIWRFDEESGSILKAMDPI